MWHKERSLWVLERKLYYGFPVPGVVASVGGAGAPLNEFSTGFLNATAGANVNDGGSTVWSNPGNVTADDSIRANSFRTSAGTSQLLRFTFNLSAIPDTATIAGVIFRLQRDYGSSAPPSVVRDHTIRLTKDGTNMVGDNKADTGTNWPFQLDTNVDYGGATDLWGTTLSAAEVKAALFGVMLKVSHVSGTNISARVDAGWLNVHYLD